VLFRSAPCGEASRPARSATLQLTSDDLQEIDRAASKIKIEGDRYPEALEKRTGL